MADAPQVAYGDGRPEVYHTAQPPQVTQYQQVPLLKQETHTYYDDARAYEAHIPKQAPATILGLRRRNFWILVVIAIVIVAATIGGSVGGSMAVRESGSKSRPTMQLTPTPTTAQADLANTPTGTSTFRSSSSTASPALYAPAPAASVALIDISCPPSTAPALRSFNDKRYTCSQGNGIVGNDITGISAYSLQQCIDACSTFNTRTGSTKCAAVVLNPDLARSYAINNGANCWLKDNANPKFKYGAGDAGGTIAVLTG